MNKSFLLIFTLLSFKVLYAQNYFGRWFLLDFMKSRTGVINGSYFSKDTVTHFITDPFLSGTYLENYKYPYHSFTHQNYEIICQKDRNVIYLIVLKYINYNKSEIYVPNQYFYSMNEVKRYLMNTALNSVPFIPIYSESYIRTLPQLKPFHNISPKEFEKVMLNAFQLFDEFEKKYQNQKKEVKAKVLINIFISQSLIRAGYCPFVLSFPEVLTQDENLKKLSERLEVYSNKW